MKLLDKLKNALFEEEEEIEEQPEDIKKDLEIRQTRPVEKIVPQPEQPVHQEESPISMLEFEKVEKKKGPIIFDDEDFLSDPKEMNYQEVPKKEEKILYGGYEGKEKEHTKEKFKPSPIISPVYGFVSKKEEEYEASTSKSLDHLFLDERKKEVSFDSIRNKAYGQQLHTYDEEKKKEQEPKEDDNLFYEMQEVDDKPGIEKITLGDAEEYYEDLGLEYEVDYKDALKERMTRAQKNQDLSDTLEEELKEERKINEELQTRSKANDDLIEAEEKNLYDLIDMMYDSKE